MTEFQLIGVLIGLATLIFSKVPFVNLVYVLAVSRAIDFDQFSIITGVYMIVLLGSNLTRSMNKGE